MSDAYPMLVTYVVRSDPLQKMRNSVVDIPNHCRGRDIPGVVRQLIRPDIPADPSDNYRGQRPEDLVIVSLIRLDQFESLSE